MAFNLTVSVVTPPDGLAHTDRKTEIMELPTYLRVTGASGSAALKLIYVGTTAPGPENIDNVWLKTDEAGTAHGFYLYDTSLGVWLLMGGPGVVSGTTVPTDTTVLWLKTDAVDAILTPGGSAVTAPQGIYKFNGTLWVCFTSTPIPSSAKEIYVQATAPTGTSDILWAKTADEKGVWYWNGAAWVNISSVSTIGAGVGASYIQTSADAPAAAIRNYVLWAKTGDAPNGLFWPDTTNGWWQSINPILMSYLYPAGGVTTIPTGFTGLTALAYTTICPTWGTAVFAEAPMITTMLEQDNLYASQYLNWYTQPSVSSFSLGVYNPGGNRNIQFRISAAGIVRIPF
jgi:hypothetical protein